MKKILVALSIAVFVCVAQGACGETWYVDGSVPASGDGKTWGTAFQKIQEGMDAASDGDTVIVAEGMYVENIHFNGKNIVLHSTDPFDPVVVANTIIDGIQAGPVVTFSGDEGETCILEGFTIRMGQANEGGGICGGTEDRRTRATIRNNWIGNNRADYDGGSLAYCDGVIQDNQITFSTANSRGGGLAFCDGTIRNNIIASNLASGGGGLSDCNGTIENNTIVANSAELGGGGLTNCDGTILNNIITGNSAVEQGGGLYGCDGIVQNNLISENSAAENGGGLWGCDGTIENCIIWGNVGPSQLHACSIPTFCCIELWTGGGEGNIAYYPYFVDAPIGDYHLRSWSPCIDAGDPTCPFSEEPEPHGGRVNMGAYGNTPEAASKSADTDHDQLPDDWEMQFFENLGQGKSHDPDQDLISNIEEYHLGSNPALPPTLYVNGSVKHSGNGTSWETAFKTIQEGIDAASDGDEVIVGQGTYNGNIHFKHKNIVLTSTDPLNSDVVATTIIVGGNSVVTFAGTEDPSCVLSGFTIRGGRANDYSGGGICGGTSEDRTGATIQNNVITDNSTLYHGGGLAYCDGIIQDNRISGNSSRYYGGAMKGCDGVIRNNTVVGNSAGRGGGLHGCGGGIYNCIIWGNAADEGDPQLSNSSQPTYSCIQDWTGGGEGNITDDPQFVDFAGGDYRLSENSPCIDVGKNEDWMAGAVDLNGNPRIFYGRFSKTVDMGAYEYGSWPFRIAEVVKTDGEPHLIWNSRPDATYTVWSCLDLGTGPWSEEATVASEGGTTSWADDDTACPCKFYRVEAH